MILFAESGHPVFRMTTPSFKEPPKSKGGRETSIYYSTEPATAELLLRIIVSVNQLTINRAMVDWCQELAQRAEARSPQSKETPDNVTSSIGKCIESRRNLVRQHKEKFENLPEELHLTKLATTLGFMRHVSQRQLFMTILIVHLQGYGTTSSRREFTYPRNDDRSQPKGFIRGTIKIGPVLEVMVKKISVR